MGPNNEERSRNPYLKLGSSYKYIQERKKRHVSKYATTDIISEILKMNCELHNKSIFVEFGLSPNQHQSKLMALQNCCNISYENGTNFANNENR